MEGPGEVSRIRIGAEWAGGARSGKVPTGMARGRVARRGRGGATRGRGGKRSRGGARRGKRGGEGARRGRGGARRGRGRG